MHGRLSVMAGTVVLSLGSLEPSMASAAVDAGADYAISCTNTAATWTTVDDEDGGAGHGVDVPKGTFTRIFSCPVGGHRVRMNFSSIAYPAYRCGAVDDGTISVWIDGTKVIDKREYDGYAQCMELPEAGRVVHRIIVNRLMHLTVCDDRDHAGRSETCQVIDLSAQFPPLKARISKAITRTPVKLRLVKAAGGICSVLDAKLRGHMLDDNDPVDSAYGLHTNTDDLKDAGRATYDVDIDNDGVPDRLILETVNDTEVTLDRLSWQKSGTGAAMAVDADAVHGLDWHGTLADFVTVIRAGGKTYIYKRDNSVADALPHETPDMWEAMAGTSPKPTPTRHLLAAGANGAFSEVCAWAPVPRPEEFL